MRRPQVVPIFIYVFVPLHSVRSGNISPSRDHYSEDTTEKINIITARSWGGFIIVLDHILLSLLLLI